MLGLEADSSWEGENLLITSDISAPEDQCSPHPLERLAISENDFEGVIDGYELPDPDIKKYDFIQIPLAEILD